MKSLISVKSVLKQKYAKKPFKRVSKRVNEPLE